MTTQVVTLTGVQLNVPVAKKAGGTYQAAVLNYTTADGRATSRAIAMAHLSKPDNQPLAEAIASLSRSFMPATVTLNLDGYNVTGVTLGGTLAAPSTGNTSGSNGTTTESKSVSRGFRSGGGGGSDPQRDRRIQSQVALKAAVEFAGTSGVTDVNQVISLAKTLDQALTDMVSGE